LGSVGGGSTEIFRSVGETLAPADRAAEPVVISRAWSAVLTSGRFQRSRTISVKPITQITAIASEIAAIPARLI